ncbi:putative MLH3 protein [Lasiosphaeria hispida]|uniref:MLH3 protein n=1 Tax=Lasiosphaeria hispida TaxID=260671 RepID=A0AAJ0M958_9PEZI|nr:putative MLH3 protein [Lasiosphaeria hispida]
MSIRPLPGDVIAQIKSSIVITSLNGVVYGLLQNSLDAGASKINVSLDYGRGSCYVEDNGSGIPPADFQEDSGLGKLHYTSRYPPLGGFHGRYGTFLASLAAMSLLTITSHHHEYRSHNFVTIHNSKVAVRNVPISPDQQVLAFSSGTRVTVRDLFGSMPVRVKQRAIEMERLGSVKSFDQLVLSCMALLLAWPSEVILSIRDSNSGRAIFLRTTDLTQQSRDQKGLGGCIVSRTVHLLTQATFLDTEDPKSWVPVGASAPGVSVSGCISLLPVASKRAQFMALGIQPLLNEHHSNILYEEVNQGFANSSFGVIEEVGCDDTGRPGKTDGFTAKELKPKKGIDRWPMFFLQIKLEDGMGLGGADDILDERQGSLGIITDLLQAMAHQFLKKHQFRPRSVNAFKELKPSRPTSTHQPSQPGASSSSVPWRARPLETAKPHLLAAARKSRISKRTCRIKAAEARPASHFATWSRVKSAPSGLSGHKSTSSSLTPPCLVTKLNRLGSQEKGYVDVAELSTKDWNPLFAKSGKLLRRPFDDVDSSSANEPAGLEPAELPSKSVLDNESQSTDQTVTWFDPVRKVKAVVDPRTGFMVKPASGTGERPAPQAPSTGIRSSWFGEAPKERRAEAFKFTEAHIPCVPHGQQHGTHHGCRDLGSFNFDAPTGKASMTLYGRISKDALRTAKVLGQVDCKFILVKVLTQSNNNHLPAVGHGGASQQLADGFSLVLIDQHAADERCRVEALLSGYFATDGPNIDGLIALTESLDKPLRFDLPRQDGELLVRFKPHFESWGICFDVFHNQSSLEHTAQQKGGKGGVTVEVQSLPASIVERCRLEPRLLVELLRKESWKLHDDATSLSVPTRNSASGASGEHGWVPRFYRCPEGVLELINSRACRSELHPVFHTNKAVYGLMLMRCKVLSCSMIR